MSLAIPARVAATADRRARGAAVAALMRRRIAPLTGLALLLAGGALAVRVTAMTLLGHEGARLWLFTAAACVLAGVALVLVAIDQIAPAVTAGADEPDPAQPRG